MSKIECPHCGDTFELPGKRQQRPGAARWDEIFSTPGKTLEAAAREAGVTKPAARAAGRKRGYQFVLLSASRPNKRKPEQWAYVARRVGEGATLTDISAELGISRERVRQLANRVGAVARTSNAAARERAAVRNAAKAEDRAREAIEQRRLEAAMRERVEAGMSIRRAGMELGIGKGRAHYMALRLGLGAVTKHGRWRHRYRDAAE